MDGKRINLEDILSKELCQYSTIDKFDQRMVLKAMKEAIKQALELAAENVNMIGITQHNNGAPDQTSDFVYVYDSNGPDYGYSVNKQSILDVINLVG
mgnify:CR=1 FL=1